MRDDRRGYVSQGGKRPAAPRFFFLLAMAGRPPPYLSYRSACRVGEGVGGLVVASDRLK
jgi:hypothetical protein